MRQSKLGFPRGWMAAFLTLGILLASAADAADAKSYTARIIKPGWTGMITARIDIAALSTPEEMAGFLKAAQTGGTAGFLKAFNKTRNGMIRFYGIEQPAIRIHAVYEEATETGTRVEFFAENRTLVGGRDASVTAQLFLAGVLELDAEGSGTGSLYENALCGMTAEGRMQMQSYRTAPSQLISVRPVK